MNPRLQTIANRIRGNKKLLTHWLAVAALALLLVGMVIAKYSNSAGNIHKAYEAGQIVVIDLDTGEQINPVFLTSKKKLQEKKAQEAKEAATPPAPAKASEIMLVINNLGLNNTVTERALKLPKPVILSFSPYAETSLEQSQNAKAAGYTVLADLPLQTKDTDQNIGNLNLRVENSDFKNKNNYEAALSKVFNPSGVFSPANDVFSLSNNFNPVLGELAADKLFLIYAGDSEDIDVRAKDAGVGILRVDLVINEAKSSQSVPDQLAAAEKLAQTSGFITISVKSPSVETLNIIDKWAAELAKKNISLVSTIK